MAIMVLTVGLTPLWAQEIKLPASVEKLSEKAEESVVVTLDRGECGMEAPGCR